MEPKGFSLLRSITITTIPFILIILVFFAIYIIKLRSPDSMLSSMLCPTCPLSCPPPIAVEKAEQSSVSLDIPIETWPKGEFNLQVEGPGQWFRYETELGIWSTWLKVNSEKIEIKWYLSKENDDQKPLLVHEISHSWPVMHIIQDETTGQCFSLITTGNKDENDQLFVKTEPSSCNLLPG